MRKLFLLILLVFALGSKSQATVTITFAGSTCTIPASLDFFVAGDSVFAGCTYTWNFGDGSTGTGAYPWHTYTSPGYYYATVTVSTPSGYAETGTLFLPIYAAGCIADTTGTMVSGNIYSDADASCTYGSPENTFAGIPVYFTSAGGSSSYMVFSNYNGLYTGYALVDTSYTLTVALVSGATPDCPSTGTASLMAPDTVSITQDFSFNCSGSMSNLSAGGFSPLTFRTDIIKNLWYSTQSDVPCHSDPILITLTLDPALIYEGVTSGPAPDSISGNTLCWHIPANVNFLNIIGAVGVLADSTLCSIGTYLCNTVTVSGLLGEVVTTDNTYNWCTMVGTSWDPNVKAAAPQGTGPEGYINNGTKLHYMVSFQNTGSDTAYNIVVRDTLSGNLNASSFRLTGASHPVSVSQIGNILAFNFQNIRLADSTSNEAASHGYFTYEVDPNAALAPGTEIDNTASIYFDSNPAVATNKTKHTIALPSGITLVDMQTPHVYPNPASGVMNVEFPAGGTQALVLTDIAGRVLNSLVTENGHAVFNTASLAPGIYFLKYTVGGAARMLKIVKN